MLLATEHYVANNNSKVTIMFFNQTQARAIVGISAETLRHWKKVIPDFSVKSGHSAKFELGDMLALKIIKNLTDSCAIKVGSLSTISKDVIYLCNNTDWFELERLNLLVDLDEDCCETAPVFEQKTFSNISIVIPLAKFINELYEQLNETKGMNVVQGSLLAGNNGGQG